MEIPKMEIDLPEVSQEEVSVNINEIDNTDNHSVFSISNVNNVKGGGDDEDRMLELIDKLLERGLSRTMKIALAGLGIFTFGAGLSTGAIISIIKLISI